jgi:pimeloyl-ACP methyl ester carboxylesterase
MTMTFTHFMHWLSRLGMQSLSLVAPREALKRAASLFMTPPRFPHSAAELRLIETAREKRLTTPIGSIVTWRIGEAHRPAVLFSHGWGGRGAQFRAFVEPLVSAGYQVVLFDHLGHGMSDHRQAALVDLWRGIEAVWDDLADDHVRVEGMIAHSLGGAAVGSALRRHLSRKHVSLPAPRVVLIAPPASLIRYSKMFARYIGIPERIRRAMQWRFEQRYGVGWDEFELPHSVASIKAPALFIHDEDDRETAAAGSRALAATWPDARLLITHGLGHRRILRSKEVIASTVAFLRNSREFERPIENRSVAPLY